MRWSVLRNFRVITETTPKQLSLKLPPAKAGRGEAWRGAGGRFEGARMCRAGIEKVTAKIVATIAGTGGNVSI